MIAHNSLREERQGDAQSGVSVTPDLSEFGMQCERQCSDCNAFPIVTWQCLGVTCPVIVAISTRPIIRVCWDPLQTRTDTIYRDRDLIYPYPKS